MMVSFPCGPTTSDKRRLVRQPLPAFDLLHDFVLTLFYVGSDTRRGVGGCRWQVTARFAFGNRDGIEIIRQCVYRSASWIWSARLDTRAFRSRAFLKAGCDGFARSIVQSLRFDATGGHRRREVLHVSRRARLACSNLRSGSVALSRSERCSTRILDPEPIEENNEE